MRTADRADDGLLRLAGETRAKAVLWNRLAEPALAERDAKVESRLRSAGITVETFPGVLLREPASVANRKGGPFQVFTPFHRSHYETFAPEDPVRAPKTLQAPPNWPSTVALDALGLEPVLDWARGIRAAWNPGRKGAIAELGRFTDAALAGYPVGRDRPDRTGTSRLSPHLHFGEISPREVWSAVTRAAHERARPGQIAGSEAYLRQLVWREFGHHLLHHFPHTSEKPLRGEFLRFPWRRAGADLRAWQRGRTGYPIVDAGMRELWSTGWMHNRVRMIVASFLVKHLLVTWTEGARWFWDTLVDANLANNTLGWQWTAGCGADAAPFFRIFNPITQGRKFDPDGSYVRRWIPELGSVPAGWIHAPWEAPAPTLHAARVRLGRDYPKPIVDHAEARARALAAFASTRGRA